MAIDGFGTSISYSTDGGTTFTTLGCVYDAIKPYDTSVEDIDTTCHDSPNHTRTFIPGLIDEGSAEFSVRREPGSTQDSALRALLRQTLDWQIEYPNGATDAFEGYISKLGSEVPMGDGTIAQNISIKISGPVTGA